MTIPTDHVRDVLLLAGYDVTETRELLHGYQLRCACGAVISVYHTGKVVPQGKNAGAVKALFEANPVPKPGAVAEPKAVTSAETVKDQPEEQKTVVSRPPAEWSDTWSLGDVPF